MKNTKLIILLLMCIINTHAKTKKDCNVYYKGGIVQTDIKKNSVTLAFTCADKADGALKILQCLHNNKVKASFFITGSFIKKYPYIIDVMKKEGHYIGSHSYAHPLYSTWENPDSTIITKKDFIEDIQKSFSGLSKWGITYKKSPYFMPPYEHYNDTISKWSKELGLQIVNFTAGSTSNADYTTPDMSNYRSSENIYKNILQLEESNSLNGHIILFHIGTDNKRIDKYYNSHLERTIKELKNRGYKIIGLKNAIE